MHNNHASIFGVYVSLYKPSTSHPMEDRLSPGCCRSSETEQNILGNFTYQTQLMCCDRSKQNLPNNIAFKLYDNRDAKIADVHAYHERQLIM